MAIYKKINNSKKLVATIDHNKLINKDAADSHPISAITGLTNTIAPLQNYVSDQTIETRLNSIETTGATKEYSDTVATNALNTSKQYTDTKATAIETKAKRIDLTEDDGELTFTDYEGNQTSFRSGYAVDNKTIELNTNDELTIKKIFTDGITITGNGTEASPLVGAGGVGIDDVTITRNSSNNLQAIALVDEDSILDASAIHSEITTVQNNLSTEINNRAIAIGNLQGQIDSHTSTIEEHTSKITTLENKIKGVGGYVTANNFGTSTPTQTAITNYVLSELDLNVESDIPDQTRVKNTFDNHLWIFNANATIKWVDDGIDTVSIATIDTLGVVKGSLNDLAISVDVTGVMTVNGLSDELEAINTALDDKVSKVTGKGLSTNDFTNELKTKLDNIADNATKVEASETNGNIQIDGTETTVYTPSVATTSSLGIVKPDNDTITIANDGTLSVTSSGVTNYNDLTNIPIINSDLASISNITVNQIYRHTGLSNDNFIQNFLYYYTGSEWLSLQNTVKIRGANING